MKKLLLAIVMAIAFAIPLSAQETTTVTVGDTTSTQTQDYLPTYFYYNGSFSEVIYLSDELQPGVITSISYKHTGYSVTDNVTLYMAEVEQSAFASSSPQWLDASLFRQVFQGSVTYSSGWVTITLDSSFVYTGMNNLAVAYIGQRQYEDGHEFAVQYTPNQYRAIQKYDDDIIFTINSTPSYPTSRSYIPVTRFEMEPLEGDYCLGAANVTVSNITSDGADLTWSCYDEDETFIISYKTEADEDWTEDATGIGIGTYTLAGLASFTEYQVKLTPACAEDDSQDRIVTLTTLPADDAFIQPPFEQNFDDLEAVAGWNFVNATTNGWYIGPAVNNTLDENGDPTIGNALYISNDNGTTNNYTHTTSHSYAYTLVNFPEGTNYGLSFDWKCVGESANYDYFRVALVNPTTEFSTSSSLSTGLISSNLNRSATWQNANIVIPDTCVGNSYALVFYWYNDGGGGSNPPAAIDNIRMIATSCARVDSILVTEALLDSPTTATVTIEAYDQNEDADYLVMYRLQGTSEWTSVESSSPITLSELSASSMYEVILTAVCDGSEYAVASETYTVMTPCGEISEFPHIQSFESFVQADGLIGNRVAPICWYNINGGNTSYYFNYSSSYKITGNQSLYYSGRASSTATGSENDWMISPVYSLTGGERLNFHLRNSYSTYIPVYIDVYACDVSEQDISSAADTSRFVHLRSITYNPSVTAFELMEVALSDFTDLTRIAIAVRQASQTFYLDDFTISAMPDCPQVHGLTVTPVTSTSAEVEFIVNSTDQAGWTIAYGTATDAASFDPATAESVIVSVGDELPVLFENLTTGATYYFAVKQNCEGGVFSDVVSVTMPVIMPVPYTQNFDDLENVSEIQFQTEIGTNVWAIGTAANNTMEDGVLTEGGALYVSNDNGTSAAYTISNAASTSYAYVTLNFGDALGFEVSFDWKAGGESSCDYMQVFLVPADMSSLNPATHRIGSQYMYNTSGQWTHFNTLLPNAYANGIYKLVFRWRNDGSVGTQPGAIIDNISVTALECVPVADVTAVIVPNQEDPDAAPAISVDIEDANTGGTYTLQYRVSGSGEWTQVTDLAMEDFPYIIEGLAHGTTYQIQVGVTCENGETMEFVSASNVSTPCTAVAAPWEETFEIDPFSAACWNRYSGNLPATGTVNTSSLSSSTVWGYNTSYVVDGNATGKLRANIYGSSQCWVVTPTIRLEEGTTYQISADVSVTEWAEPDYAPESAPDDVFAILVSTDNGTTWSRANGLVYADGDADTEHNFSDLGVAATRCIFKLVDANEDPISGDVRFAFYGGSTTSNGDNDWYIDNISVTEWSACQAPYGVSVVPLATTATATFTVIGTPSGVEYVLVEGENADPDAGTPVALDDATATSIELTGLVAGTTYTFAVRTICEEGESVWSSAVVFTTLAEAVTLPYSTTFDDPADLWNIQSNNTNSWAIGSATFAGEDGNSAYVSNDGGVSYAATSSSDYTYTYTYLYKDFEFGEDATVVYNLDFDYKGVGWVEGTDMYAGLVVYLVDPTPLPTADFIEAEELGVYAASDWTHESMELTGLTGMKRLVFLSYGYITSEEAVTPNAVDNVSIQISTCPAPQNLVSSNVTSSSVDLAWEGTADSYVVSYRKSTETEFTTIDVTSTTYTLTDLDNGTEYVAAVQSVCGGVTGNVYSNTVSFSTTQLPESLPYACDFEQEGNNGWLLKNGSATNRWYVGTPTSGVSGATGSLFISENGTTAGYDVYSISVVVAEKAFETGEAESITVSFDLTIGGESSFDYLKVYWVPADTNYSASTSSQYYSSTSYSTNILVRAADNDPYLNLLSTTQTMTATIENTEPNTVKKLVFVWRNDGGVGTMPGAVIDNISISTDGEVVNPDPCDAPSNITATNITQTTATISWNGSADSYEIKLNGSAAETVNGTTKSYTGLTASTDYTVEIRAVCENDYSDWAEYQFTTLAEQGSVTAPAATTINATNITHESATLNGNITLGSEPITSQGFKYQAMGAASWETVNVSGTNITTTITGLTAETTYRFKAFATTATDNVEGDVLTFQTTAAPVEVIAPEVTTLAATNVTHVSATLNGTITPGNETITQQGFRYKETSGGAWITVEASGNNMVTVLNNLNPETSYTFRAFVTTASGTVNGAELTFTTIEAPVGVIAPTVTTFAASSITDNSALLSGTIAAGNEEITSQGFMWRQDGNPDWTTVEVAGETITHTLTGLQAATIYYVKAFATTATATTEGEIISFQTLAGLADVASNGINAMLYPNPASDKATLSIEGLTESAQIVVSDAQGRILFNDTMSANTKTYELNVASYAAGVYYIRIISGQSISTQKLIVR